MHKTNVGERTATQLHKLRDLVQERLTRPGVSLPEVARASGLSRAYVHHIKSNRTRMSVDTLAALAAALDVSMPQPEGDEAP